MKLKEIRNVIICSTASMRNGIVTVRQSFFYRNGGSADKLASRVLSAYPTAQIIDKGEVWKPFRGGASVANQSHWFVKFTVPLD